MDLDTSRLEQLPGGQIDIHFHPPFAPTEESFPRAFIRQCRCEGQQLVVDIGWLARLEFGHWKRRSIPEMQQSENGSGVHFVPQEIDGQLHFGINLIDDLGWFAQTFGAARKHGMFC